MHPTRAQYNGDMCNSTVRKSIDQMLRSMFFFQSVIGLLYQETIPDSTLRDGESRMGEEEACLNQKLEEKM